MSKPGFDQETWYGCCSQHVPWDLEHISSLCWEKFLSDSKKRSPSSGSWLKKQRQDCLPRHGGIGHAEEQTSTSLVLLNLDCLLSGLWQKKKKERERGSEFPLFSPFMLPKGKPKQKHALWSSFLYEKINRPLFSERLQTWSRIQLKLPHCQCPGEKPLNPYIPLSHSPDSLGDYFHST